VVFVEMEKFPDVSGNSGKIIEQKKVIGQSFVVLSTEFFAFGHLCMLHRNLRKNADCRHVDIETVCLKYQTNKPDYLSTSRHFQSVFLENWSWFGV